VQIPSYSQVLLLGDLSGYVSPVATSIAGGGIDGIQNYKIVIATLFRHFEWGKYQKFPLRYVEIQ